MHSNFEIVGQRKCESCGSTVNIIKVHSEFRQEEISRCLNCDSKKIQEKYQKEYEYLEETKNVGVFNRYSMIPEDIQSARFGNYKPETPSKHEAKRSAMEYVKSFKKIKKQESDYHSLLFQGSYGLGKSHLAYSIARELIEAGHTVIYIDVPQLLQMFRDNIKNKQVDETMFMKAIEKCDLLVIDDLGAEYVKKDDGKESWTVDKLFQVFSIRNNKPKIITTNYNSAGLQDKYGTHGGRIISRMMMGTRVIKLEGKDYRMG